jgi:4-hydroxybenzoate polyprenyltransferase
MWQEIFNFLSTTAAVACCSAAVKLADDYLDREFDAIAGKTNWAEILGQGTMLYAMFLLALAAGINTTLSLSLFLASYVVGMFNSMREKFPSRLNGFQESLLALTVGMGLFGWNNMVFSFSFVLAVQLFDDYLDVHSDHLSGQRNLANRFGCLECLVLGLICIVVAWGVNEDLLLPVAVGTTVVYLGSMSYDRVRT